MTARSFIIVLLLLLAGLQYKLWFAQSGFMRTRKLKNNIHQVELGNQKLIKTNATLAGDIKTLQFGHASVEDLARDNLGMIKPKETFYRIIKGDSHS
jgi:cell division protein FtsB